MFSDNRRISKRQMERLLIYDLFGMGTLLLPGMLAGICGRDGIFAIALAGVVLFFYLKYMKGTLKEIPGSYPALVDSVLPVFLADLVKIFYYVFFLGIAGYSAYILAGVVLTELLENGSFWLILTAVSALAVYGIKGGIEGRARIYELLFWFLMIPLFAMLIFAAGDVNADYWTPVFSSGIWEVVKGAWVVICFLGIFFVTPFLTGYATDKNAVQNGSRSALFFILILLAVIYQILLGIFEERALAAEENPILVLMSLVRFPGGFLKRQDTVMTGIWFFTLFSAMDTGLFYGSDIFAEMTGSRGKTFAVVLSLALVFALAGVFYRVAGAKRVYYLLMCFVGVPAVMILPPLLAFFSKKKRKGEK